MTRRANPLRVGLFTVLGLALLAAVIISVTGGKVFSRNERAVLNFANSVWGLQTGAPVVLRGVRVGSVVSVGLAPDASAGGLAAPVSIDIDGKRIPDAAGAGPVLPSLLKRGLRAKLSSQSLLTGRLFIDLDFDPKLGAEAPAKLTANAAGAYEIPTVSATSMSNITQQLEGLNVRQLVQDIAASASSVRRLTSSPELARSIEQLAGLTESLARAGAAIEKRVGPLADGAQNTMADTRRALGQLSAAADRLAQASERIGGAAGNAEKLLAADSPLVGTVKQAVEDIGRSATALRNSTADDSAMMQNLDGTMAELRRTSRSVRELAELLERQPDALLRGKAEAR
jgi:paraquat-inducible protein B